MPVRAKAEEEEREWDEIVRVLRDMDGCGVLGARAIAIGRASVRIGSGSSAAAAPASAAAEEAEAAQASVQHWQQAHASIQQLHSAPKDQRVQRQQHRRLERVSTQAGERHLAGCGLCPP